MINLRNRYSNKRDSNESFSMEDKNTTHKIMTYQ